MVGRVRCLRKAGQWPVYAGRRVQAASPGLRGLALSESVAGKGKRCGAAGPFGGSKAPVQAGDATTGALRAGSGQRRGFPQPHV